MSVPESESESDLKLQAFPQLSADQIDQLRPFGTLHQTHEGEILFDVGDRGYPMIVILSGTTEIVDRSERVDHVINTGGPGDFHGELNLLTGQKAVAACVVRQPGEVLLIPPAAVRDVVALLPSLSDVLVTAFESRRRVLMQAVASTLTIIGPEDSPTVLRLLEFAERNRIPHRWLPPDDPFAMQVSFMEWPPNPNLVRALIRGYQVLREPSNLQLAKALGLDLGIEQEAPADLVVVGAGPAGLAAAVYGASEGLATVAVDDVAIGGQAGTSSRIENYLGFPTGIAGGELAFRAEVQALKFGARVSVPREATALRRDDGYFVVRLDDLTELRGRSVVIATGARYRRLGLQDQERYEGNGIYYAATELEARRCRGLEVIVVGGGNSAGQAAMFLAENARCVRLVYRGPDLARSMSQYLLARLEHAPTVRIHTGSEVTSLHGEERLEAVTIGSLAGEEEVVPTAAIFVMIGAEPCTDWLRGVIDLDERGFIRTGFPWGDDGPRSPYQTSLPGVFAVGDVRDGSVKRVASAVGEGSVVVQAVHQFLAAETA